MKKPEASNSKCTTTFTTSFSQSASSTILSTSTTKRTRGRRRIRCNHDDNNNTNNKSNESKIMLASLLLFFLLNLQQVEQSQETTANPTQLGSSNAIQSVLLDTTEHSALNWIKYPDGGPQTRTPGWVEESFTNFERGINWRSFVVCDVAFDSVNNWLWTPFIERNEASRLYIELKFTMRDCNLFPQAVRICRETFALLYKEVDAPIGGGAAPTLSASSSDQNSLAATPTSSLSNATFAQSDSFVLVDQIAADEGRFTSNTDVVINTELRSVPVTKRGVYFAFRDMGACLSLIALRVYHLKCPPIVVNFARFNATPTGRDLSSLVAVEGACVPHSVTDQQQQQSPRMFCGADGSWNSALVSGSSGCKCLPGYEPAANNTKCQACPPGKFKAQLGDASCVSCPENSYSPSNQLASSECKCQEGYYRSHKDARTEACTQPPGAPANLSVAYLDSSTLVLSWQEPKFTGGRDDTTYRLICDQCADSPLLYSPQFVTNFSETKCVVTNLSPSTSYRFLLYAMNGVSHLASSSQQQAQFSEITVQTARAQAQSATNTLSAQGGFSLTPIYNLRALPGARGSDMVLAWDAQPLQPAEGLPVSSLQLMAGDTLSSSSSGQQLATPTIDQQLPALYEIRYQPRFLQAGLSAGDTPIPRHPPYNSPPLGQDLDQQNYPLSPSSSSIGPQSVTTTNRAVVINGLSPRTEYAFQIRAKWAHSNQWTDFSEPIYMATTSSSSSQHHNHHQFPHQSAGLQTPNEQFTFDPNTPPQLVDARFQPYPSNGAGTYNTPPTSASANSTSWFGSFTLIVLCALIALLIGSLTLIHYRKTNNFSSAFGGSTGFGTLSAGSTYGGVYGGGVANGLMGGVIGYGSPLGNNLHPHAHHHHQLSASSAGGLITGSNATSRSSSGAGNVVQNFIAATLAQINGTSNTNSNHHHQQQHSSKAAANMSTVDTSQTLGALEGKLFASAGAGTNSQQHLMRNHYHQTLGAANHSMLLGQGQFQHQQQQQQQNSTHHLTQYNNNNNNNNTHLSGADLFKYRALSQQQIEGAPFDCAQMHIYDDLDAGSATAAACLTPAQRLSAKEIEPHRVHQLDCSLMASTIKGEFGQLCKATLLSSNSNSADVSGEFEVSVRLLRPQASERAKLDFLLEAALMSHFEHANVLRLEALVSASEPGMLLAEWTQHGPLDVYLRDNKGSLGALQLISMLRGIAHGMQYLAKLNFVHKDLAARNILVNGEKVCKIANLSNFAAESSNFSATNNAQTAQSDQQQQQQHSAGGSTNSSSQTLSSQSGANNNNSKQTPSLTQLMPLVDQLVAQRLTLQQPTTNSNLTSAANSLTATASMAANTKLPIRWTALEAIAFRRFTSASDVWSFGVVCWEMMSDGERPYWTWSNQYVIKALEAGYRLEQPNNCPDQLYRLMLDCWLKDRAARPTFGQIVKSLDRLLSPYEDPFAQQQQQQQSAHTQIQAENTQTNNMLQSAQLVPSTHTRLNNVDPAPAAYYESYNLMGQLEQRNKQAPAAAAADDWLSAISMSRYKDNFKRNQIVSLQQVARLGPADLALLGVQNNQHVKRMLSAIQTLRTTSSIGSPGEGFLV